MFDIWTGVTVAIYLGVIAAFFSSGRSKGFKREGILEKATYWDRISIYSIVMIVVLIVSKILWSQSYFSGVSRDIGSLSLVDVATIIFILLVFTALPHLVGYYSVPTRNAKILKNGAKNLARGRAIATGLGFFAAIIDGEKILLRTRTEKGSLFGNDLSGKWELPGGGMEIRDMKYINYSAGNFYQPVLNTISRETLEEVFLEIVKIEDKRIIPAYLFKNDTIDLAHVAIVPFSSVKKTPSFEELLSRGEVKFFSKEEVQGLNFVSQRMKYMVIEALSAI